VRHPVPILLLAAPFLALPATGQTAKDSKIQQLKNAKDWLGLADYIETLPDKEKKIQLYDWIEALSKSGRWPRLIEVCDAALPEVEKTTGPRFGPVRYLRASAYSKLGRHAEAWKAHLEIARLGFPASFYVACDEARAAGDWPSLQICAETALAANPSSFEFQAIKGEALAKQERFAEAEPVLLEASKNIPKRAMVWADLASCMNQREAYREAYEAADRALQLEPRLLEGLCNRGRASIGLKHYREGRNDYASALALNPVDPAVAENLRRNVEMADRYLASQKPKAKSTNH